MFRTLSHSTFPMGIFALFWHLEAQVLVLASSRGCFLDKKLAAIPREKNEISWDD